MSAMATMFLVIAAVVAMFGAAAFIATVKLCSAVADLNGR
jgi:hypothetical protein